VSYLVASQTSISIICLVTEDCQRAPSTNLPCRNLSHVLFSCTYTVCFSIYDDSKSERFVVKGRIAFIKPHKKIFWLQQEPPRGPESRLNQKLNSNNVKDMTHYPYHTRTTRSQHAESSLLYTSSGMAPQITIIIILLYNDSTNSIRP
jgi:hypothetical protein